MSDPLGLIGSFGSAKGIAPFGPRINPGQGAAAGGDFKQMLQQQLEEVNQLQTDANQAVENLAAGQRDDVESVIVATQKADVAFRMLLQVRNKVMDAYEEIKQIRI